MTAWPEALERYEASRPARDRPGACNAPFSSMYFAATGAVAPCWILLERAPERWGPHRSLADIWGGEAFTAAREALAARTFRDGCGRCGTDIAAGLSPLAAVYDEVEPGPVADGPVALELELSNRCNYACLMCNGDLSSRIRREREGRAPLDVPYDDTFVDQVAEVLPGLRRIRFSGGEPLLHPLVHAIADRIVDARPDLRIDVSTNGSVLNDRVRRLLERAEVQVNVSFESFRPEVHERIRVGADFARVMGNLEAFLDHFRDHPGLLTVNANPMRDTWEEMPDFVRWCDERDVYLTFNTVLHPEHLTLRTLPAEELRRVRDALAAADLPPVDGDASRRNRAAYDGLVAQVGRWADEAALNEAAGAGTPVAVGAGSVVPERELRSRAEAAAGAERPVVVVDIDADWRVTAVHPSVEVARSVGLELVPGARAETPVDALGPALAHPELSVEAVRCDPATYEVSASTPAGAEVRIWSREREVGGVRAFVAVLSMPVGAAR